MALEHKIGPIEYNLRDYYVPFFALRHIPELKNKDKIDKSIEIAYMTLVIGTNLAFYSIPLYGLTKL